MSNLFRKEALSRRSRALFGEIILRSPLSALITLTLIVLTGLLVSYILFGLSIEGRTVIAWITRDR